LLQNQIITIAKKAGDEIMKFYQSKDLIIKSKTDDSPVTAADLNAHQIIFSGLSDISNELIISEESESGKHLDLRQKKFWLVDPLDGTRDFVAGRETFCVSIAFIDRGEPVLGVLYSPVLNEVYYAKKNAGSFFNDKRIFNTSARKQLYALASGAAQASQRMQNFLKLSKIEKLTRYGSALKFAHLARGDADVYPRFGETSEWDTAAGQIICREAGCEVFDIHSLQTLTYAKKDFRNLGFIAVREDLLDTFKKMISDIEL